jgi:glycosyltransferase involved in cell wall biosynthesis
MKEVVSVSVVIPSWKRVQILRKTLSVIGRCDPSPAEVLVHVDGGEQEVLLMLKAEFPTVKVLSSETLLGPGGSRNRLIAAARHELVANFDDDSYPQHKDYFARVLDTADRFPDAAVLSSAGMESEWCKPEYMNLAVFSGCGCVFRKSWFGRTTGFVPLPIAYSMEEVDISLQLHALGGEIVHDPFLRVLHDRVLPDTVDAATNAHILANTALLPFLRYPMWLWGAGICQVARRVVHLFRRGWTNGLLDGLQMIPDHLARYKAYRRNVTSPALLRWLLLKQHSTSLGPAAPLPTSRFE